ncbi:hypothetical protein EGR_07815 [Echinococcus granulosus]|uniref:Uncharacterized protein n=1 Tax=Echinococcus granulosus TaxID=6210 RepID=W6UA07_ECHGR|nr:hypothetical protein EGR_07815 [Echinococcus granulosus]EUB57356.1 hypothetical protein EGR_07815 [Echinococcus granulosus]
MAKGSTRDKHSKEESSFHNSTYPSGRKSWCHAKLDLKKSEERVFTTYYRNKMAIESRELYLINDHNEDDFEEAFNCIAINFQSGATSSFLQVCTISLKSSSKMCFCYGYTRTFSNPPIILSCQNSGNTELVVISKSKSFDMKNRFRTRLIQSHVALLKSR